MANPPNELDESITNRLKVGTGNANYFYLLRYVDDGGNKVYLKKADEGHKICNKKFGNVTFTVYIVYAGIASDQTPKKEFTEISPDVVYFYDDYADNVLTYDYSDTIKVLHSSFPLLNAKANKITKTNKKRMWYLYLAFMPNKK
ncbi:MAG: hypothetical protein LBC75_08955 [Fibromonadaceae bacterium]|jgi:hypothetical protein|nr:hypothetical protein [Fibromonadaceae bacterium]